MVSPCKLDRLITIFSVSNRIKIEEGVGDKQALHLRESKQDVVNYKVYWVSSHSIEPNALKEHCEGHELVVGSLLWKNKD